MSDAEVARAADVVQDWFGTLCGQCGADQTVYGGDGACRNCEQVEAAGRRASGTQTFLAGEYRLPDVPAPRDADDLSAQAVPPSALNRFGRLL